MNNLGFKHLKINDEYGSRYEIIVPERLSDKEVVGACYLTERLIIKHGGSFTELAYQAYLDLSSWFTVSHPERATSSVKDFSNRMKMAFKRATKYQQRLSNKEYMEVYFGNFVRRNTENILLLRSSIYSVMKRHMSANDALDASFVGTVYILSCYQCTAVEGIKKRTFEVYGINWFNAFDGYFIDNIASFADRLLRENWKFDIVANKSEMDAATRYVFDKIDKTSFSVEEDKKAIDEAMREVVHNSQQS